MKLTRFAVAALVILMALPLAAQVPAGFGFRVGSLSPSGDYLDEWYSDVTVFGITYIQPMNRDFNVEFALEYSNEDGKVYNFYDEDALMEISGISTLEMTPFLVTLRYQPCRRGQKLCFYIGAGGGYYYVEEKLDYDVYDDLYGDYYRAHEKDDDSIFGLHAVVGIDILSRRGGSALTFEVRWSSVDGTLWGEDMEFGGTTATIGYRFGF